MNEQTRDTATDVVINVFVQKLLLGDVQAVAYTRSLVKNGAAVISGRAGMDDLAGFQRRVLLTARATQASYVMALWPVPAVAPKIGEPFVRRAHMMFHMRGEVPCWNTAFVYDKSDGADRLDVVWLSSAWEQEKRPHPVFSPIVLAGMPTDDEAEQAFKELGAETTPDEHEQGTELP